jgi:putative glutamine amidotransferase
MAGAEHRQQGPKPLICISASAMEAASRRHQVHATGERNVHALRSTVDCIPLLLPPVGDAIEIAELVRHMDGLILTGGRANVEPHHYDGPGFPADEPIDPGRDNLVLPLVRACVEQAIPVFGICRGIQEMNVALGGSLHYRVHLLQGKQDHRMPRSEDVTQEEIFRLNHPVHLTPGGLFESLAGASEVMVNSLHGQAIDRVADDLEVEAVSPDGVIEGVRLRDDPSFTVGVQWHAEWRPEEHTLARGLYRSFGAAARARARRRHGLDEAESVPAPARVRSRG